MKFAAALVLLGFVAAVALADDTNPCANANGVTTLKNAKSGKGIFGAWSCMSYTRCDKDKKATTEHCLGWPILPLKQYSPRGKACEWFWNVNCEEADA